MSRISELPSQGAFFHAILRHLASHPEGDRRGNIHEAMPTLLELTEAQRTERLTNLPHLRYRHRSGWGLSMLKRAGYVESAGPGLWRITNRGRDLVALHPNFFDEETAKRIMHESRRNTPFGSLEGTEVEATSVIQPTPGERIDITVKEIYRVIAEDLLERILQAPQRSSKSLCSTYSMPWVMEPALMISNVWVRPEMAETME